MKFDFAKIRETAIVNLNKGAFLMRKHSPEILIVLGIVGAIGSTGLACAATLKAKDTIDSAKEEIKQIKESEEIQTLKGENDERETTKQMVIVYAKTSLQVAKFYAPAVTLGTASIISILAGNQILRKRNAAIAAAFTTVSKTFDEYRARVVDRYGEEVDRELRYGIKKEKRSSVVTDEDGNQKKVKELVDTSGIEQESGFARVFDKSSKNFEKNSDYNQMFLRGTMQYCNDKLRVQGHLFLNEIYDMLDVPRSKDGQVVGWIYDPDDSTRKNCVKFIIHKIERGNEREAGYIIDFEPDGIILNQI